MASHKDFQEVQETLALHPHINITKTEGEPPDIYEIEYNVNGMTKDADGTVSKAARHLMLITLPFGYPHFPPAVKPLTPIFHPDMDPDAVRISSYWQDTPSLARLIVHLGEMICGKQYDTKEPFNQEAADWYESHADELPCEDPGATAASSGDEDAFDLGIVDIDIDLEPAEHVQGEEVDIALALESAEEVELEGGPGLDLDLSGPDDGGPELPLEIKPPPPIRDVADLSIVSMDVGGKKTPDDAGIDDLGLEVEDSGTDALDIDLDLAPPEPAATQQDFTAQLEEIQSHIQKKEMEIAGRLLSGLPASVPEAEELRQQVQAALAKRDELLAELKAFEDQDDFEQAKKVFKKIKATAVDTPDLAEIGRRLSQSQNMLDAFSLPTETSKDAVADPAAVGTQAMPVKVKKEKKKPKPPPLHKEKQEVRREKTREVSRVKRQIIRTAQRQVPVMPFAIAAGIAAVIIVIGLIYTRDTNTLLEAQLLWQDVRLLVRKGDCTQADAKAAAVLTTLKSVLTPMPSKSRIREELAQLQASEAYLLCREGKAEYKGESLPRPEVEARLQLDKLTAEAQDFMEKNDLRKAYEAYEKAYLFAEKKKDFLAEEAEGLRRRSLELCMETASAEASEAETEAEAHCDSWDKVVKAYEWGLECADKLGDQEKYQAVRQKRTEAVFDRELCQQKENFKNAHGQWQELLEQLQKLKKILRDNPEAATAEKTREVEQLMVRAEFYQLLYRGNQAYGKSDHNAAVASYEKAAALLQERQALFTREEYSSAGQIRRAITLIQISTVWNQALQAEDEKNLFRALDYYEKTKRLLDASPLTQDEGLLVFEEKVERKISRLRKILKKRRNLDWLKKNYKRVCMEAHPSARADLLSSPQLNFIRRIGGQELYKISCLEGRMYRLELHYLHNPATDRWTRYTGPVD